MAIITEEDLKKLDDFFDPNDIEWRIQSSGFSNGSPWAIAVPYVTNRAIMDRLDSVCGKSGWQNEFRPGPAGGVICRLSIYVNDRWITKEDGAENTEKEPVKGGLSGAMKRAAVHFGIGRYLYNLPIEFVIFSDNGQHKSKIIDKSTKREFWLRWDPPKLPEWAMPGGKS